MTGRWRSTRVARLDRWRLALAAIVLASAGAALCYGSLTPRGFAADESAHTDYAVLLGEGRLPSVDTPRPGHEDDRPRRADDYVYVANHPPLFAAAQAAASRSIQAVGLADDPELAVGRGLNALAVLGAVLVTAGLGRELSGSRRLGVLAAGLFAAAPELWSLSTYGYSDGAAVLATALVAWAGVRAWKRLDRASLLGLGAAVALAGAVRATSLVAALLVAGVVGLRAWWAPGGADLPAGPGLSPPGLRRAGLVACWTALPVVLVGSWWYVRNWLRFGDPVASDVLIGRLDRAARPGGIPARLADLGMWRYMATDVTASVYSATYGTTQPRLPPWAVGTIGAFAALAVAGLVLPRTRRRAGAPVALLGWAAPVAAVAGVALGIALHTAGGGSPHPRYLLPALPVLAVLAVCGLERLHPLLTELAVAGLGIASLVLLGDADAWVQAWIARTRSAPLGPDVLRTIGRATIAAGLLGAVAVAVGSRWRPRPGTPAPAGQR